MDKVDDFIGSTFTTPKGGMLTVVGIEPRVKGKHIKYKVECNICSKDEELFPEYFTSLKAGLTRGGVPCLCTLNSYKWSYEQTIIRIERECKIRNYKFLGFAEDWKGYTTKLILYCNIDNLVWETTTTYSFFNGVCCPTCMHKQQIISSRKEDSAFIKDFMSTGSFCEGSLFERYPDKMRPDGAYPYWKYTCPVCINDEYTGVGLCTGSFISDGQNLRKGKSPCRCSGVYRWTKEQREYQVSNICRSEGLTFLGWDGLYKRNTSKFLWLCKENHPCITELNSFLQGCRCATCSKPHSVGGNGFYPERINEKDFLYVMDFLTSNKVGRSFDIEKRRIGLRYQAKVSYEPFLLQSYTASHAVVYGVEQEIHAKLRECGFQYRCDWTKECFTKNCGEILQYLLDGYVSSGTLTRVT